MPVPSRACFQPGGLRHGAAPRRPLGALAAFLAFTLPSAALLVAFALGAALFQGAVGSGILSGLKIVAVAIVAQAVWGMARALTPDRERAAIAVVAALSATLLAGSFGQISAILFGALAGLLVCRRGTAELTGAMRFPVSRTAGIICLALFVLLLLGLPVLALATGSAGITLFEAFYRAGALVFGGGHVVLPLLQAGVVDPGWVTSQQFLAGYGAAQAVPGPLFTFAAYLGAAAGYGPGGVAGAAVALAGIFLPGFLLLTGVLPFWNSWRSQPDPGPDAGCQRRRGGHPGRSPVQPAVHHCHHRAGAVLPGTAYLRAAHRVEKRRPGPWCWWARPGECCWRSPADSVVPAAGPVALPWE